MYPRDLDVKSNTFCISELRGRSRMRRLVRALELLWSRGWGVKNAILSLQWYKWSSVASEVTFLTGVVLKVVLPMTGGVVDGSMRLWRWLGLSRAAGLLNSGAIGRARNSCSSIRLNWLRKWPPHLSRWSVSVRDVQTGFERENDIRGIEPSRKIKWHTRFTWQCRMSTTAEEHLCGSMSAPLCLAKRQFRTRWKGPDRDGTSCTSCVWRRIKMRTGYERC